MVMRSLVIDELWHWFSRGRLSVDLPQRLTASGCPQFAERVRRHLQGIDVAKVAADAKTAAPHT